MKFTLVFTVFLVLLGSLMSSAKSDCYCPAIYKPVCGKNGKTYSNSCEMAKDGVPLAHEGPCGCRPCGCRPY